MRPAATPPASRTSGIASSAQPATIAQAGDAQRPTPLVGMCNLRIAPQAAGIPQARAAVDRREQRAERAHAAAADEIDPDARLVQRAQHAGVVCAGRSEPVSTSAVRSRVE